MKRVASVKGDGTVELDVPGDIKPPSSHLETGVVHNPPMGEEEEEESIDLNLPPMQIVMLIVGTRGDVQPFVAIGKRLQVCSPSDTFADCLYIFWYLSVISVYLDYVFF